MSVDDIRMLLRDAVADVHADPRLGDRLASTSRRRQRRSRPVVAVAMSVVLLLGVVAGAIALIDRNPAPIRPAATSSPEDVLPTGPDGPTVPGNTGPTEIVGQVHALGSTTAADGRRALTLVLFVRFRDFPAEEPDLSVGLCSTRWVPGTALRNSKIDRCVGGRPADEPPVDGPAALLRPPDDADARRFMRLSKETARAEVKLARTSEWRAYATPEGGNAPVRLRQPVQLLGANDPAVPQLIAIVPPIPAGYRYLGTDSWDADGRQILDTREGNYCGPDPSKPAPPVPNEPCPG